MTTSIVIPVYNGEEFLKQNLPIVTKLEVDEIIVVNDASTDESAKVLADFPKIKVITHTKNTGFPIAVNDGFKNAAGDIIFLLNQDLTPDKSLIKNALPHFSDPKLFAVTFNEQEHSWADAEIKNGFLEFKNGPIDDKIHSSFWASGGSAAFRKSTWDQLEGFDQSFSPGYFEDLDISWRARNKGFEIIWDPKVKVIHVEPESTFNKTYQKKKLQRIKDRNYLLAHWNNLSSKYYFSHIYHLASKILRHPGYLIPVVMALYAKFN